MASVSSDYNLAVMYPTLARRWPPTRSGILTSHSVTPPLVNVYRGFARRATNARLETIDSIMGRDVLCARGRTSRKVSAKRTQVLMSLRLISLALLNLADHRENRSKLSISLFPPRR
jgi:hypothetical protein